MPLIPIDRLDDPRVQSFRDVKAQNVMRGGPYFLVEGTKTVERLLGSRFETTAVLLAAGRVAEWEPKIPAAVPVYVLGDDEASALVGFRFHVGVMACGRRERTPPLESLLGDLPPGADAPGLIVACPNCDNPENLGTIARISAAFGVRGLLLGSACCDPFSRRVIRVSMGAALTLPIRESRDFHADLRRLRDEWGFELAATVLDDAAEPLHASRRSPRMVVLLGNEANGLDAETLALAGRRVTIPMAPGTDSLNVAIAAGIFLHHWASRADA